LVGFEGGLLEDFVDKGGKEFAVGGFFALDFAKAVGMGRDDAVVGLGCDALDKAEGDGVHGIHDA
jgi:hypothetical protein